MLWEREGDQGPKGDVKCKWLQPSVRGSADLVSGPLPASPWASAGHFQEGQGLAGSMWSRGQEEGSAGSPAAGPEGQSRREGSRGNGPGGAGSSWPPEKGWVSGRPRGLLQAFRWRGRRGGSARHSGPWHPHTHPPLQAGSPQNLLHSFSPPWGFMVALSMASETVPAPGQTQNLLPSPRLGRQEPAP